MCRVHRALQNKLKIWLTMSTREINIITNQFELNEWVNNSTKNILIFTTYHSLHKVCDAVDVEVDTIYYDEHNGTSKNFFEAVARMSFHCIS